MSKLHWRVWMAAFAIAGNGAACAPARTNQPSNRTSIESLERVRLGGMDQAILIRGSDQSNPVLLWLHGGPGSSMMPLAHHFDRTRLLERFTVVHWDQRGAGKSFDPALKPESLTVEQYVTDALELIALLKTRFGQPKLYLVGHSWGAMLGALVAARAPGSFHALIGVGQAVDTRDGYALRYDAALRQARATGNAEAVRELEGVGAPPWSSLEGYGVVGKWNAAFGNVLRGITPDALEAIVARSPFHDAADAERSGRGAALSTMAMLEPLNALDLRRRVTRIDAPVYVLHGRFDLAAPSELALGWLEALQAPRKTWVWFEQSAHFPMYEEPAKFDNELLRILEETKR
jgi:pimeloyl-ACP methyl ester carboxylesterase